MSGKDFVLLNELMEKMRLENLTPEIDTAMNRLVLPDINRPAIQLTGYFEHFAEDRLQVCGLVEHAYMGGMSEESKKRIYDEFLSHRVPAVIFCRGLRPDDIFLETAVRHQVPVLLVSEATSPFMAEVIRWLNVRLAPMIAVHGVLIDIYGIGVLITGESGIGKSEAAIELIKRGHRLVSDDVVEIRRVSEETLIGTAPAMTKYFIEIRGIGIVNVRNLFGVSSIRDSQNIDLVIRLEEWERSKTYDRMGLDEEYEEYLGNRVVCHRLPIRPGRNLAIICEAAAANHRLKRSGYNAAKELEERVNAQLRERGIGRDPE